MGRISGFFAGLTLTSSALYFSLLATQRHRATQRVSLQQQALLLHSILDPDVVPVEDAPRFVLQQASWTERWKDRWNEEVEGIVRAVQRVKWEDLWRAAEGAVRGKGEEGK